MLAGGGGFRDFSVVKDLRESLGGVRADSVLEVGCGDGRVLRQLAEALPGARRLVGVDVDLRVPGEWRGDPRFEWVAAAGHELPFADGEFGLAAIVHVLHHLEPGKIRETLAEMLRVLQPGGALLIYEMYRDGQNEAQLSHVRYHHWVAETDRLRGISHHPTFLRAELMKIIGSLDLDDLKIEDFNEEKEDPLEPQAIDEKMRKIDERLESIRSLPDFDRLAREAEEIKEWIRTHGILEPTRLIALGRKR